MRSSDPTPRKHPLFPTLLEASKNPSEVYSDHLLMLAHAVFGTNVAPVNILSLNMLGPGSPMSGFHKMRDWESPEQAKARYARMIRGLAAGIETHQVDIIVLQEVTSKLILPLLKVKLPQGWGACENEQTGLITCFDTRRFTVENPEDVTVDSVQRICSLRFKDAKDGKFLTVHNVWGIYDPFPHTLEKVFKTLLEQAEYTVIIGDTNSRIAPIDTTPRNITTNIIPILINKLEGITGDIQRPDYADGGFCRGADGLIHQLKMQALHYETAAVVADNRTAQEIQAWPEFRMVLCLDHFYQNHKVIAEKNIFEYQMYLQEKFQEDVVVRMAADCFNHKAIGIRFMPNSHLHKFIINKAYGTPGFQHRLVSEPSDTGRTFPVIFMPIQHIELLHKIIQQYANDAQPARALSSRNKYP